MQRCLSRPLFLALVFAGCGPVEPVSFDYDPGHVSGATTLKTPLVSCAQRVNATGNSVVTCATVTPAGFELPLDAVRVGVSAANGQTADLFLAMTGLDEEVLTLSTLVATPYPVTVRTIIRFKPDHVVGLDKFTRSVDATTFTDPTSYSVDPWLVRSPAAFRSISLAAKDANAVLEATFASQTFSSLLWDAAPNDPVTIAPRIQVTGTTAQPFVFALENAGDKLSAHAMYTVKGTIFTPGTTSHYNFEIDTPGEFIASDAGVAVKTP